MWLQARRAVDRMLSELVAAGPAGERRVRGCLGQLALLEARAGAAFADYRASTTEPSDARRAAGAAAETAPVQPAPVQPAVVADLAVDPGQEPPGSAWLPAGVTVPVDLARFRARRRMRPSAAGSSTVAPIAATNLRPNG
jgi:hypothetical protein